MVSSLQEKKGGNDIYLKINDSYFNKNYYIEK
jgi:hypothetical protein